MQFDRSGTEKFNMILTEQDKGYNDLPGIAVLVGGMWIANLYYWVLTNI